MFGVCSVLHLQAETEQRDVRFVLDKTGLSATNLSLASPAAPASATIHLVSQLSPGQLLRLYQLYKQDFLLFGYKLSSYFAKP